METKLNTYTFQGIRWIPGYDDFDCDDYDIEAQNEEEAWKELHERAKFWKAVSLTHINGEYILDKKTD